MQRNMELIRQIMLSVEGGDLQANIEGYDKDALNYHKAQLIKAGLLEGKVAKPVSFELSDIPQAVVITDITWAGHDFIDAIRSDTKWNKIKNFLAGAGKDLTIETIKTAARQLFGFGDS